MSPPVPVEVCLRVQVDLRVYLIRYAAGRAISVAQESFLGGEMWRLPVEEVPAVGYRRDALRAAEAFIAGFRLPAVAS